MKRWLRRNTFEVTLATVVVAVFGVIITAGIYFTNRTNERVAMCFEQGQVLVSYDGREYCTALEGLEVPW